jgi:hypothetical protein
MDIDSGVYHTISVIIADLMTIEQQKQDSTPMAELK